MCEYEKFETLVLTPKKYGMIHILMCSRSRSIENHKIEVFTFCFEKSDGKVASRLYSHVKSSYSVIKSIVL